MRVSASTRPAQNVSIFANDNNNTRSNHIRAGRVLRSRNGGHTTTVCLRYFTSSPPQPEARSDLY